VERGELRHDLDIEVAMDALLRSHLLSSARGHAPLEQGFTDSRITSRSGWTRGGWGWSIRDHRRRLIGAACDGIATVVHREVTQNLAARVRTKRHHPPAIASRGGRSNSCPRPMRHIFMFGSTVVGGDLPWRLLIISPHIALRAHRASTLKA